MHALYARGWRAVSVVLDSLANTQWLTTHFQFIEREVFISFFYESNDLV